MTAVDPLVADLRVCREKTGLTQRALAEAAGIGLHHVEAVERGRRVPSLAVLRRLGQALGVQPGWLPLAYETASVERCTPAGNGAAEGGLKSPPVAPASDPAPVDTVAGSDVALIAFNDALAEPCDCDAHNEIRRQMQDPEFAAAWERALERDPVARTLEAGVARCERCEGTRTEGLRWVGPKAGDWRPIVCTSCSPVLRTLDVAEQTVEMNREAS